MSKKYPNIISKLPDDFVANFVRALEQSDEEFIEKVLEFAEEWSDERILRFLQDQMELSALWLKQNCRLDSFEALLAKDNKENVQ